MNGADLHRCPDAGCAAAHAANVYKPNHCQYRERGYYMASTAYSRSVDAGEVVEASGESVTVVDDGHDRRARAGLA